MHNHIQKISLLKYELDDTMLQFICSYIEYKDKEAIKEVKVNLPCKESVASNLSAYPHYSTKCVSDDILFKGALHYFGKIESIEQSPNDKREKTKFF